MKSLLSSQTYPPPSPRQPTHLPQQPEPLLKTLTELQNINKEKEAIIAKL